MLRHLSIPLVALALSVAGAGLGCAAPAEEATDDGAAAISPKEALDKDKYVITRVGLENAPASADVRARFGVASWSSFVVIGDADQGSIVFGVDRDGDVKYAIATMTTYTGKSLEVGFFELAKDGAKSAAAAISSATYQALVADANRAWKVIADAQPAKPGECFGRIVGVGLGVAALAFVGVAVAGAGAATGLGAVVVSTLGYGGALNAGAVAAVVVGGGVTTINDAVRKALWTDTLRACR